MLQASRQPEPKGRGVAEGVGTAWMRPFASILGVGWRGLWRHVENPANAPEHVEAARELSHKGWKCLLGSLGLTETVAAFLHAHRTGAMTPSETVARSFVRIKA